VNLPRITEFNLGQWPRICRHCTVTVRDLALKVLVYKKRMISGIVKIRYPQHKVYGLTTVLSADVRSSKLHTASTRGVQTSADAGKVIQNTYV